MLGGDASAKGQFLTIDPAKVTREDIYRQRVFGNDSGRNSFIERQDTRRLSELELIIYVVFMCLCVWYTFERITVWNTFEVNTALKQAVMEPNYQTKPLEKNFESIIRQEDLMEWISDGLPEILVPTIGEFNIPITPVRFTWRRPKVVDSEVDRFKAYYPKHWDVPWSLHVGVADDDDEHDQRSSYGAYRLWAPSPEHRVPTHLIWHLQQGLTCTETEYLDELEFGDVEEAQVYAVCQEWCEQIISPKPCRCFVVTGRYRCTFFHVDEHHLLRKSEWEQLERYQYINQPDTDRIPPMAIATSSFTHWPTMRMFLNNGSSGGLQGYRGSPGYVLAWDIYPDADWYGVETNSTTDVTQEQVLNNQFEDWFVGDWFVNNTLASLAIDVLTLNPNYAIVSWVQLIFVNKKSSNIGANARVDSLTLTLEDLDSEDYDFFSDLGVVGVLYLIIVVALTCLELFHLFNRGVRKYFAVWWNWVTMASLTLHFATLLLWFRYRNTDYEFSNLLSNLQANDFVGLNLDVRNSMLIKFETQVDAYKTWLQVSAYNLLFLFIQLVHYLHDILPSVQVLITTMTRSVPPVIFLVILILDILLGFVFAATILFGTDLESFHDFSTSFTSCMELLFGNFQVFHEMQRVRAVLATVFFFFYMIIFKYIMENFARAIIILSYEDAAVKFKEEKDAKNRRSKVVQQNRSGNAQIARVIKWVRQKIRDWSEDIQDAYGARDDMDSMHNFNQAIVQACVYLFFIVAYCLMVYLMVRPSLSHDMQEIARHAAYQSTYSKVTVGGEIRDGNNFTHILDRNDVMIWMEQALPQMAFDTSQGGYLGQENLYTTYRSALPAQYDQLVLQNYNIIIGQEPLRMTLRYHKMVAPGPRWERGLFSQLDVDWLRTPVKDPMAPVIFDDIGFPEGDFEEARELSEILEPGPRSFLSEFCAWTEKAYGSTPQDSQGGWVCMLPVDKVATRAILREVIVRNIFTNQTGMAAIDYVMFNGYAEAFAHVAIAFSFHPSGRIDKGVRVETVRLEYSGAAGFFIWFFSITILVLSLLYLLRTLAACREVCNRLVKIYAANCQDRGQPEPKCIDGFVLRVRTTLVFFLCDMFNLVDLVSCILTIAGMVIWFEIYSAPLRSQYYFAERPVWNQGECNSEGLEWCADEEVLELFAEMARDVRHLIRVQAFNLALVFIRFLRYSRSIKRMEVIFSAIRNGIVNVQIFILVFFAILTGYTLAGLQLFGADIEGFTTVGKAYRQCFDMFLGTFDYKSMRNSSSLHARIFFFSFMILFKYVIVNMFTAIMHMAFFQENQKYEHELEKRMEKEKRERERNSTSATVESDKGWMKTALDSWRKRWVSRRTDPGDGKDVAGTLAGVDVVDDGGVTPIGGHANGHTANGQNAPAGARIMPLTDDAIDVDLSHDMDRMASPEGAEAMRLPNVITEDQVTNKKWKALPEVMKTWALDLSQDIVAELEDLEEQRREAENRAEPRTELEKCLEEAETLYTKHARASQKAADDMKDELEREELHGLKIVHQDQESLAWYIMKKEAEHQQLQLAVKNKQDRLEKMRASTRALIDSSGEEFRID